MIFICLGASFTWNGTLNFLHLMPSPSSLCWCLGPHHDKYFVPTYAPNTSYKSVHYRCHDPFHIQMFAPSLVHKTSTHSAQSFHSYNTYLCGIILTYSSDSLAYIIFIFFHHSSLEIFLYKLAVNIRMTQLYRRSYLVELSTQNIFLALEDSSSNIFSRDSNKTCKNSFSKRINATIKERDNHITSSVF